MNEKITFPRLATMLADRSGRSKRFSEDFLREFFALISERLEAGESVKVKGLGTFRLSRVEPRRSIDVTTGQPMEISGHSKVVFIPSKELAEAVNAPFEAFSAIEISDDTDLSQLFTKDEIELQEENEDIEEESAVLKLTEAAEEDVTEETKPFGSYVDEMPIKTEASEEIEVAEETEDSEAHEETEAEEEVTEESESPEESDLYATDNDEIPPLSATESTTDDTTMTSGELPENEIESEETPARWKTWQRTLMISLGAAVVALIATFAVWYVFATNDFNRIFHLTASNTTQTTTEGFVVGNSHVSDITSSDRTLTEDTVDDSIPTVEESEVPTAPSDAIVYDTISTTRYLTTMAKAHYGNFNLWPYIYEENKAILGHPDRIRPGTPVVIPKLSRYGVDPANKEDVEKAKKMGVEIYARYGKKI